MCGEATTVAATTTAIRTDTASAGGPVDTSDDQVLSWPLSSASRSTAVATIAAVSDESTRSLLMSMRQRASERTSSSPAQISSAPARTSQTTSRKLGRLLARSMSACSNCVGGSADETSAAMPSAADTSSSTSVARRARGRCRTDEYSRSRRGRDHIDAPLSASTAGTLIAGPRASPLMLAAAGHPPAAIGSGSAAPAAGSGPRSPAGARCRPRPRRQPAGRGGAGGRRGR